jgi:hypothetical protein
MSIISDPLAITLQELDDNPDTWGDILNSGTIQLLESAFMTTTIDVTASDATLDDTQGGDALSHYRYGIINVTGTSLASTRNVNLPVDLKNSVFIQKGWLVINSTTGGQNIVFKTSSGAGVTIPPGNAYNCYCDGTDIVAANVLNASTADLATLATDSNALGTFAAALYARLAQANSWTAGQVTTRTTVSSAGGFLTINCANSNAFFMTTSESFTINAPTNATNGQTFSLAIQQGGGGPHTIGFAASTFAFAGASAPVLSTTAGDLDYLAFEYVTGLAAPFSGSRWVGSVLKDFGDV